MYIFKFRSSGGQVMKWDASDVFVWHPEILAKNPGFGASCHGQVICPEGPLTKWSTSICFPSEKKTKRLGEKYFCIVAPHFGGFFPAQSQTVIKHSQRFFYLSSPNRSFFQGQRANCGRAAFQSLLHRSFLANSCTFSVISTAVTMQITRSAGLLIGSTDASSRFKWKC